MSVVWGKAFVCGLAATLAMAGLAWGKGSIQAWAKPEAGGLSVVYALPASIDRFVFQEAVEDVRADTWHVPDDMVLAKGELRRKDGRPFRTFTVMITPDSMPRDRRYPALTRVGEGWQVYGPYFRPADDKPLTVVRVTRPKGWVILPAGAKAGDTLPLDSWAFVGPAAYVTKGPAMLVVSPAIDAALKARIAKAADETARFYGRRLDARLPTPPTVIATRVPTFPPGWQGDTSGPVATLRFFGPDNAASETSGQVAQFVAHEFFHLWNNRAFHSRDGENEAWLHEGMAEYAALLASRDQGDRDEAQVGRELASRLGGCVTALDDKGLGVAPPRRGVGVYDCGVLVQWSADLKIRRASHGREDVFDLWRGLFADAATHGGEYDGASFLKIAGESRSADDPLRLLVEPGGAGRWPAFVAALNGLGARIVQTRSPDAERHQMLFHLLNAVCAGSMGYYGGDPKTVKLDTGTRCGALNGDLVIDSVAGHGVVTDALAARDAVAAICAVEGEVPLTLDGKVVATTVCKTPMPERPLAWTVEAWR